MTRKWYKSGQEHKLTAPVSSGARKERVKMKEYKIIVDGSERVCEKMTAREVLDWLSFDTDIGHPDFPEWVESWMENDVQERWGDHLEDTENLPEGHVWMEAGDHDGFVMDSLEYEKLRSYDGEVVEEVGRVSTNKVLIYGYNQDGEAGFTDKAEIDFTPLSDGAEFLGDDAELYILEAGRWCRCISPAD